MRNHLARAGCAAAVPLLHSLAAAVTAVQPTAEWNGRTRTAVQILGGSSLFDIASWGVVLIGLLGVCYGIYLARSRISAQRRREEMLAQQFEIEALSAASQAPEARWAAPCHQPVGYERHPVPAKPAIPASSPPADPVAAVMRQLEAARLVRSIEGRLEVNGDPNAATIVKLTNGKMALIVGSYESEAFAQRNLRRFDLIIFVGGEGKAIVLNRLESLIADSVSNF